VATIAAHRITVRMVIMVVFPAIVDSLAVVPMHQRMPLSLRN